MQQKAEVEVYTWDHCPYCQRVVELFDKKGIKYARYKIDGDEEARIKMSERANGRRSVPQIFIGNKHIGGCDDTCALDDKGQLDPLILEVNEKVFRATSFS